MKHTKGTVLVSIVQFIDPVLSITLQLRNEYAPSWPDSLALQSKPSRHERAVSVGELFRFQAEIQPTEKDLDLV